MKNCGDTKVKEKTAESFNTSFINLEGKTTKGDNWHLSVKSEKSVT